MCEKCNDSLIAAANAVSLLAAAAKDLYSINMTSESATLAKAAADLFTEVKEEAVDGVKGSPEAEKPKAHGSYHIDHESGVVFLDGVPIGRILQRGQKTMH